MSDLEPITTTIVPVADTPEAIQVIYTNILLAVLVTIWTGLRLYSRHMRRVPFGIEDYLYMLSLILYYAFITLHFMMQFLGGAGHHIARLQPWHVEKLMKFGYATQVVYAISLGSLKISILLMLQRIFFIRPFKIAAWITMGLAGAWTLMTILIGLLICRPIAMQWDPTIPGGECGDQIAGFAAVGVVDLIVDLVIFILPIPMVLKLQVSKAHRLALVSIFGAGVLTIVFGGLRLASVFTVDFLDFSYTSPNAMTWSSAEMGVALMVSSSPILRPVFDRVFGRFISTLRSSANRTDPHSKYYNGAAKSGATGPRTLISASKHPSRAPDGFMAMSDSDENLEMSAMDAKGMPARRSKSGGRRSEYGRSDLESGNDGRDDASTDKIYVRTEIVQQSS
ncbi:integral membrane protein [Colletotrichum sojae]|uniref:Integral membrane protein n=1 Tax=Colletotrichum sojae TaxID=2175907 RepID=A0A8H6MJQ6_9PEZI|nr:integral membrane protein [Colletotrichum sojae]